MTPLEVIGARIEQLLPAASVKIDAPSRADGEWWLDISYEDHPVTLQWSPRRKLIGISASIIGDGIGDRPEETFDNVDDALARVLDLFRQRGFTRPPARVSLREIRSLSNLTQAELAERLGIGQAAVSRFERREDVSLQALAKFVNALGCRLEVSAITASGERVIVADSPAPIAATKSLTCEATARRIPNASDQNPPDPRSAGEASIDALTRVWNSVAKATENVLQLEGLPAVDLVTAECPSICALDRQRSSWRLLLDVTRARSLAAKKPAQAETHSSDELWESACRNIFTHEAWHLVANRMRLTPATPRDEERQADTFAGCFAAIRQEDAELGAETFGALGCDTNSCAHGSSSERTRAFLNGYSRMLALMDRERTKSFNLFVLRSVALERSRLFYEAIGFDFKEERHGNGPTHFAASRGRSVFELYPCGSNQKSVRLGVDVPSLEATLENLHRHWPMVEKRMIQRDGARAACVVRDPDGNDVELVEPIKTFPVTRDEILAVVMS